MINTRTFNLGTLLHRFRHLGAKHHVSVHSVEYMRYLVQRERYRVDRGGQPFALLAIHIIDADPEERELTSMIRWLQLHVRITDDVGDLDDGRIGILLPDTDRRGAEVVAERIRSECRQRDLACNLEIQEYPDQSLAGPDDFDHRSRSRRSSEGQRPEAQPVEQTTLMRSLLVFPMPWWKRTTDIVVAGALLVLTSPLQLAIAAAVKLSSPGPAFYSQHRSGLGGRPFRIVKFRTMRIGADLEQAQLRIHNEQDGPAFKMTNDPRVTTIGRILRKTSLDELPQLWNVFRGDMSLVGPRPLPCHETEQCTNWQRYRLDVTPGITCIWQVYGRGRVGFIDWMRMDVEYLRSRSPLQDSQLLCLTLPAVLSGRGAV